MGSVTETHASCRCRLCNDISPSTSSQPSGGVDEAELFLASIIKNEDIVKDGRGYNDPTGSWRDGIFDCFMLWLLPYFFLLGLLVLPLGSWSDNDSTETDGLGRPRDKSI